MWNRESNRWKDLTVIKEKMKGGNMAKKGNAGWPSKTGNKSGGGRDNGPKTK